MKLFSGPEKTITDERVMNEYYKAGHFSYVIIICLIFLDYLKLHEFELTTLPYKKAKRKIMDLVEKEFISNVLEETAWNRSKASKILDLSYKTLLFKIQDLDIQPSER